MKKRVNRLSNSRTRGNDGRSRCRSGHRPSIARLGSSIVASQDDVWKTNMTTRMHTSVKSLGATGGMASVGLLLAVVLVVGIPVSSTAAGATATPTSTTASHYEASVDSATLFAQGRAAGLASAQGLVILDF